VTDAAGVLVLLRRPCIRSRVCYSTQGQPILPVLRLQNLRRDTILRWERGLNCLVLFILKRSVEDEGFSTACCGAAGFLSEGAVHKRAGFVPVLSPLAAPLSLLALSRASSGVRKASSSPIHSFAVSPCARLETSLGDHETIAQHLFMPPLDYRFCYLATRNGPDGFEVQWLARGAV